VNYPEAYQGSSTHANTIYLHPLLFTPVMKITVRVFGELTETIGNRHTITLEEDANIGNLTRRVAAQTGQRRQGHLGEYRIGGNELAILLNGRNVELMQGLKTRLHDGDEVVLMIYTMGG
jgi:molybdopterin converting factor small subunit